MKSAFAVDTGLAWAWHFPKSSQAGLMRGERGLTRLFMTRREARGYARGYGYRGRAVKVLWSVTAIVR